MKVAVIENKSAVSKELSGFLGRSFGIIEVIKIEPSVVEAIAVFKSHSSIDLVFCDVELMDGLAFEIFKKVKITAPVIYLASNEMYALKAFQYNGIDYILKPFTKNDIVHSIEKYNNLLQQFNNAIADHNKNFYKKINADTSLLVTWKDRIIPVKIKDIALFNIEYKMTQVITLTNRKYFVNNTLEDLENVCGTNFYRANRQFLINREVVAEAAQHYARKLVLKLKLESEHEIIISKNRVPQFLDWLRG